MTDDIRSFQTAAHRRGGKPLTFKLEHYHFAVPDDEEGEDVFEPTLVERTVMVNPLVDIVAVASAFKELGEVLKMVSAEDTDQDEKLRLLTSEMPKARNSIRKILTPPSRRKWDEVAAGVDVQMLGAVVTYITGELSGKHPTQPESSSGQSSTDGPTSTDGQQPEV